MSYYLSKPVPQFYYLAIKNPNSQGAASNNFWVHVLPLYFTQDRLCGLELEQRPLTEVTRNRVDITILSVRIGVNNVFSKRVVFINGLSWDDVADQLLEYLKVVHVEQDYSGILYGICAVGSYVRFYSYNSEQQTLEDYRDIFAEKSLELMDNEQEIDTILTDLANKTCEGNKT
ncbi:hypothetical protein MGYG_04515 [Nannizzia gypsea CBS 118893]|uniref:Uncharacterized protein n=1 Tax=Arthroderma gypseum (strain ATCC MYA-4604 / CBS 118893) TaxID=535722 RepID=E4UTG2_ARTGP|nr:hypothetical protein MGYG_04515 [Nannizzia gypsea CBS 118893]EFR01507.1 hypothetical protein MGYG_04515 [Nannizzia gypsea CBS 118893]